MKYLKKFATHEQYLAYINGSDALLPNVSLCVNKDDVHYNPTETNVLYYTASQQIVFDDGTYGIFTDFFDATVVSHTFENGEGKITFDQPLTRVGKLGLEGWTTGYCMSSQPELTSLTLPKTVTVIGDYAFAHSLITTIVFPDSVTTIGARAFKNNYMENITLGSGVTSIGDYAFNCTSNPSVTVTSLATTPPTAGTLIFDLYPAHVTVYVPSESLSAYQTAWLNTQAGSIFAISE